MKFIKDHKRLIILILIVLSPIILAYYSDKFGNVSKKEVKPTPPTSFKPLVYQCPSIDDFCTKAYDIKKDNQTLGFGGDLRPKSPILASFDGTITSSTTILPPDLGNEKINTIYLDNDQNKIRAIYYFKGDSSATGKIVKQGEVIGTSLSKISTYNASLIFQIIRGDPATGVSIKITNKDFVTP